jgi:hypothetical protein
MSEFQVGDQVLTSTKIYTWTIVGLCGDQAWLKGDLWITKDVKDLTLIPDKVTLEVLRSTADQYANADDYQYSRDAFNDVVQACRKTLGRGARK